MPLGYRGHSFFPKEMPLRSALCEICTLGFNFADSIRAKRSLKGSFSCRIIIRHGRFRFSASGKSIDVGRGRIRNIGYKKPAIN
ncbi:hypothetical protein TNCV_1662931 [Trichonephila clavipes]|nr:hypothetical protein TNCV_1662931 [Trichonephila clavipes]